MLSVREKYWRYSLFVLIAGLGLTIFAELTPFLGGLLGAVTIYVLLRRQMWFLSERRRWRRSLAASLLLGEAIFFFLVPISLIVWMVVDKIQGVALDPQSVITPVRHVAGLIQQKTGYDLWSESNLQSVLGYLPRAGQWLVGGIVNFAVNLVVLLFVLYFMLIGGLRMETYCREILPFDRCAARSVMREIHMIVRSNAIVIPLLAVSQGVVAYVGYLAFGVPEPLFWGVLTCFATILPIVGTALVWLPLAAYMSLDGNWGQGVGLVMYGHAGRHAGGQPRADGHAEEDGRRAPAHHHFRGLHRSVALRLYGRHLRAADAGDVCLLRQCLQTQIPRRASRPGTVPARRQIGRMIVLFPVFFTERKRPGRFS